MLPVLRWSGPDEDAREAAVRNWKRVVQITVDLGVNVINTEFSGRPERAEESERAFFRSMEELVPIFEREGIDVRIDPHPDDFVEDGMEALRIIRGVNSPNIGMVFVACHIYHMGGNMGEIIRAAGNKLRLVHVADTMDHHRSHGLRYITNPPGNPARVHQHLKIGDGDVDWDEFFGALAEIDFYQRPDTVMVSSVFAEDENAHEVSRYQLNTMTDYVSKYGRVTMSNTISHWIDNKAFPGSSGATAPVTNPATGEVTGQVALGQRRGRPRGDRRGGGGVPRVAGHLAGQAHRRSCSRSASCSTSARVSWPRSSPASTARSSPMRSARSAAARRSSSSPAASRICSRAGSPRTPRRRSTCTRSASRWGRSASSARSTSRPWCRCGSSPSRSPPATPSCSSRREKDPSASLWMAELWAEAGLPPGVFNVLQGDKTAVDELLTNKAIKSVSASSGPPRSRSTCMPPAPRPVSGCRPWAGRRTTR